VWLVTAGEMESPRAVRVETCPVENTPRLLQDRSRVSPTGSAFAVMGPPLPKCRATKTAQLLNYDASRTIEQCLYARESGAGAITAFPSLKSHYMDHGVCGRSAAFDLGAAALLRQMEPQGWSDEVLALQFTMEMRPHSHSIVPGGLLV
jgi:hypothetical protein